MSNPHNVVEYNFRKPQGGFKRIPFDGEMLHVVVIVTEGHGHLTLHDMHDGRLERVEINVPSGEEKAFGFSYSGHGTKGISWEGALVVLGATYR